MNSISVSVVILATDENKSLRETVDYINNRCTEKIDKTIIVLSRNASEECISTVEYIKKTYGDVIEWSFQSEDGLGCAAMHGIKMVKTTHMTFFPADLAIELKSLDRMISVAKNNPEKVVKTSRWLESNSFVGYNKFRYVFNKLSQLFLRVLFMSNLTDLTNPVQVIPTAYEQTVDWKEKGVCTMIEHTIVPVRLGYKCVEVPAKCLPRTEGISKNSRMQTVLYLKTAFRVRFSPIEKIYKN